MKTRAIVLGVVLVLLIGALVALSGLLDPDYETSTVDEAGFSPSQELLARGSYLAKAGDCTACHTAEGGAPFAGGVPIATPFGVIYGTNITPDEKYGIGNWNSADFYKAIHDGISPDHSLYPAMPYTSYRGMSREDSDAIFAYLKHIRPVAVSNKDNDIPFPFTMRFLLRGWNFLFLTDTLPNVTQGDSAEWVRGRYLTNVLGHCTECHTPRGVFGQLKLDQSFQGGALGKFEAPDITPQGLAARGWTTETLQQFLAYGLSPQGSAYGQMFEAFHHSTQHLNEHDNHAMVRYLTGDSPLSPVALPEPTDAASDASGDLARGRGHYLALCAGCHAVKGQGKPNITVPLNGNSTVRNASAHNLIRVVLDGLSAKQFPANQGRQSMPGFADKLSDEETADLVNYLRVTWGGQKSTVQAGDVQAMR